MRDVVAAVGSSLWVLALVLVVTAMMLLVALSPTRTIDPWPQSLPPRGMKISLA